MGVATAEKLIRKYLSERYDVSYHPEPPGGLYLVCPDQELYLSVVSHDECRTGPTRYIAVNKNTGAVREAGDAGLCYKSNDRRSYTMQYTLWISQAREHWRENQPQRYTQLKKAGELDQALREAAEATQEEMETLQAQGLDWHQSWEMVRELYLFPPAEPEAWEQAPPSSTYLAFAGLQQLRQQQAQEDGETPPDVSR